MKFLTSSVGPLTSTCIIQWANTVFVEQDEVIDRLRKENEVANHRYSMAMKVVVGLSCILYVLYSQSVSELMFKPAHLAGI